VLVQGKTPSGSTEVGSSKIAGDFYRNGGNLVGVGTNTVTNNFLAATTASLDVTTNPKRIGIAVSPGVSATIEWAITVQINRRLD
jgi:hypothetical protein